MKKMTIQISGKSISCEVIQERKNSVVLQPEGKKNLFRGNAKVTVSKKHANF